MKDYRILKKLSIICSTFNIGSLIEYEKEKSNQNNVYKVTTSKGIYIIKEYTKDAIGNYYYLNKRKKQIKISKILNRNGIKCVIPKSLKKHYFKLLFNRYYLVYDYFNYKNIDANELTKEQIQSLAITLSKIHKLNLKGDLPCCYKKVNIDFDKFIKKYKNNKQISKLIAENRTCLEEIITKSNNNISNAKKNLCISHNDYKPKNILWEGNFPILIDFDATGMCNPTAALLESAFNFFVSNKKINYEQYKYYLECYTNNFENIEDNFEEVIYVSMNGKLQWFQYIMSSGKIEQIISMIEDLVFFYNSIDEIKKIYDSL